jgi:DnaJ-class molecular chaperone
VIDHDAIAQAVEELKERLCSRCMGTGERSGMACWECKGTGEAEWVREIRRAQDAVDRAWEINR